MISQYLAYRLGRATRSRRHRNLRTSPITVGEVERDRRLLLWVGIPVLVAIVVCIL